MSSKLIYGFVIGFIGYFAYRQLQRTQTVTVNTDTAVVPTITGGSSAVTPYYTVTDPVAGVRG